MRVIATAKGHCGKQVREPGDVFDFDESRFKKDDKGNIVFPSWFVEDEKKARAQVHDQMRKDAGQPEREAKELEAMEAAKKAAQKKLLDDANGIA